MNIAFCNWKVVLTRFRHRKATGIRKCETCLRALWLRRFIFALSWLPIFKMRADLVKKERKEMFRNESWEIFASANKWMNALERFCSSFFREIKHMMQPETCVDPSFWPVNRFLCLASSGLAEIARCCNRNQQVPDQKSCTSRLTSLSRRSPLISFASHRVCRKINSCLKCEWGIT